MDRRKFLFGIGGHGLAIKMKPFDGFEGRCVNGDIFKFGDEVQDIAAMFALAEAIPNIPIRFDAKLCRIRASVNGTRTAQAVSASLELVEQAVML